MASVLIIRADFLHNAPAGLKKYVDEYFRPQQILGHDVMVAVRACNADSYYKGQAPSHNCDTRRYSDGCPAGMELNAFIRAKVTEGLYMWELNGGDDPVRHYGYDDD
jgi:hypothetical protein